VSRIAAWLQASRPLAQVNIALPLLLGQALAFAAHGRFSWRALALVHAFGLVDQLFIVFANDYADADTDRINTTHAPYSGGSRVIPEGKLSAKQLRTAAWVMAASLVGVSAWGAAMLARPWTLGACALAIVLMWAYSFRPLRLSYRGHGEILQGLGLGVVLPVLGYYVQTGTFEGLRLAALLPVFLLGHVGNINTSLPDQPSDLASDKRSYPVRVGQYRARRHSLELLAIAACFTPLVTPRADWPFLLVSVLVPLLVLAFNVPLLGSADAENRDECRRFVTINAIALNLMLAAWMLGSVWTAA
jgi:1,4-dihydroxy-2-naphthoate octaprenyltransferase